MFNHSALFTEITGQERNVLPRNYRKDLYYMFFSKRNLDFISNQITLRLEGVHPQGKHIIVPDDKILSVMDSIYNTAHIEIDGMTMMTISYIVDHIKNEYEIENQNKKLNKWVIQYTNDSNTGLVSHPKIKIREKRPAFTFNMNY